VYGEPIVSWDFENGIPANWINESDDGISHWEYRGPSTDPDNTVCSRGTCGTLSVPPASNSLENGFVIFDSNYWDAAGVSCGGSVGLGPAPGPHNAYLITESIDLSEEDNVTLTFQHQFKLWPQNGGPFYVSVSVDQGEWIDVYTSQNNAQNTVAWVSTNLNAIAANQSDVRIRFRFTGTWYYWALDDIYLFKPSQNDLIASNPTYTNYDNVEIQNLAYNSIPEAFIRPFDFGVNALNVGGMTQTGVHLEVNILNELEEVLHTQNGGSTIIEPSLTATFGGGPQYLPELPIGLYNIEYTVSQDQEDEMPENNTVYEDFEITEYTYARDEGVSDGNSYPPLQYQNAAFEIGNIFECHTEGYQLNSIAVALSDESEPGDLVYGIVYNFFRDTVLAQTLEYPINSANLNETGDGKWMIIPLETPLILTAEDSYNVQVGSSGGENKVRVCASGFAPNESSFLIYPVINFLQYAQRTPMVRMQVFPVGTSTGCTDELAVNYDPSAEADDGSCQYPGCTDELAANFDPMANFDDGSCVISGCTDENASNYNPEAIEDDGSCLYPGCTNPMATNYDPAANIDDGSCIIPGCTDVNASNYDSEATEDDGSCVFLGCTDEFANNFNPIAIDDDGSCEYNLADFTIDSIVGCAPVEITIVNNTETVVSGTCSFTLNEEVIHEGCEASFSYEISEPGVYSIEYTYTVGDFNSSMISDEFEIFAFPEIPTLSFADPTLSCSGCDGFSISWFQDGEAIPAEDSSEIEIVENGLYAVQITNEADCSAVSEELQVIVINLENEFDLSDGIRVYPNPTLGICSIDFSTQGIYQLELYNSLGEMVFSKENVSSSICKLDIQHLNDGMYTLRISQGKKTSTRRLIKVN